MFITFEGGEGSGKSTQLKQAGKHLRDLGYKVIETREPGGSESAERIRNLILNQKEMMDLDTEIVLYAAARRANFLKNIKPYATSHIVLCDRFIDSSFVYQGYARGGDMAFIRQMNKLMIDPLYPDKTFFFDVPADIAIARIAERKERNRFDDQTVTFHEKVRKGYLENARQHPNRFVTINANQPIDHVSRKVNEQLLRFVGFHLS